MRKFASLAAFYFSTARVVVASARETKIKSGGSKLARSTLTDCRQWKVQHSGRVRLLAETFSL